MAGIWNQDFTKVVQDGVAGNQSQKGVFFDNDMGLINRLTQAEGHELSYNPEIEEKNPIGQAAPEDLVRSYRLTFGKDIIIKKGEPNYEFFANWLRLRPTGSNARLSVYLVDFRMEEIGLDHNRYYTEQMDVICTVESSNETDATLTVNFSQAGEMTTGIMERTDSSTSDDPATFVYGFTPSNRIAIGEINLSKETANVKTGEKAVVAVSFSPLGCPHDFTVSVSSNPAGACVAERVRQSVVIRGRGAGQATVTITSTSDAAAEAEVEVTVSN